MGFEWTIYLGNVTMPHGKSGHQNGDLLQWPGRLMLFNGKSLEQQNLLSHAKDKKKNVTPNRRLSNSTSSKKKANYPSHPHQP